MKRLTSILFAALVAVSFSYANTSSSANYTFTIHIGAFVKANLNDFQDIRPLGYLYAKKLNNLTQIYMGDYATEAAAMKVEAQIKAEGYVDAFVTRRNLDNGDATSVIHLGTEPVGTSIDWSKYIDAGPLQTYQKEDNINIVTGPFKDLTAAQKHLDVVNKFGFTDAFIKSVNETLLHDVTTFETGGVLQPLTSFDQVEIPVETSKEVVIAEIPPKKKKNVPNFMVKNKKATTAEKKTKKPADNMIPKTYEKVVKPKIAETKKEAPKKPEPKTSPASKVSVKSPAKSEKKSVLKKPYLRPKVKRTSVLRLQEVLKSEGTYKGSLDGFYGKGTKAGYAAIIKDNKEIQKYKLLNQIYKADKKAVSKLQYTINHMDDNIAAGVSRLKAYNSSLSKVYQAYGIFALSGNNKETDRLMNQAIKNTLPNKYKANQTYSDYKKLIQHIRSFHEASDENIEVPAWLFQKHPKLANATFEPLNESNDGKYTIQDFGNITEWESLSLLETIMKEMTPDLADVSKKTIAQLQSKRAALLLAPQAQSLTSYKSIDNWNTNLWKGIQSWEKTDPLHSRYMTPLKVAYFQSWALLEDYYMDKGFTAKEARGLSLCVLQTIVDPYLGRYAD